MPEVKSVSVRISVTGAEDAKLKIDQVAVAADKLKNERPEITPQIDSAKALMQARILRAGLKAEFAKAITERVDVQEGLIGRLKGLLPGGGGSAGAGVLGGGGGILGSLGGIGGGAGWGVIVAGAAALVNEIVAVAAGFTAAAAGAGAFGALALPVFKNITSSYTEISKAQQAYQDAVAKAKIDPTKSNIDAVKRAADNLKLAWQGLNTQQTAAVKGLQSLSGAYQNLSKAFQPQAMKIFNDGLKIANDILPHLTPLATAFANALDPLLKKLDGFVKSKGFSDWLGKFSSLIGPATTAIGQGLGRLASDLGKLLTTFSGKDVAHAINILFDTIDGAIRTTTWVVNTFRTTWDHVWSFIVGQFLGAAKIIVDGAAIMLGWVPGIGGKLRAAAAQFDQFAARTNATLKSIKPPPPVKIKADGSQAYSVIGNTSKLLGTLGKVVATPKIHADASQAYSVIGNVRGILAALNNVVATPHVTTIYSSIGVGPGHHAMGGPSAGLTWVGEQGPELVYTPPGSYVYNAGQSAQMARSGAGGPTYNIHVNALVADRNTGRLVVEAIRQFEAGSGHSWRK